MRRRRRKETGSDPRQQALHLIELALDDATMVEERRSAAVRAVKHIDKYDLLSQPFAGNETVQAAMSIADTISNSGIVDDLKTILAKAAKVRGR